MRLVGVVLLLAGLSCAAGCPEPKLLRHHMLHVTRSVKAGAHFVHRFKDLDAQGCRRACCRHKPCDLAIHSTKLGRCFLFHCGHPTQCTYSWVKHYDLFIFNRTDENAKTQAVVPKIKDDMTAKSEKADGRTSTAAKSAKADGHFSTTAKNAKADGRTSTTAQNAKADGRTSKAAKNEKADGRTSTTAKNEKADGRTSSTSKNEKADGHTSTTAENAKADGRTSSKAASQIKVEQGLRNSPTPPMILTTRPPQSSGKKVKVDTNATDSSEPKLLLLMSNIHQENEELKEKVHNLNVAIGFFSIFLIMSFFFIILILCRAKAVMARMSPKSFVLPSRGDETDDLINGIYS